MSTCSGGDIQHNKVVFEKLNDLIGLNCTIAQEKCPELDWNVVQQIKEEIQNGDSVILDFETLLSV